MYNEHILSNGMKVVMSKLDVYRSVSVGFWIRTGSANESEKSNGISHFIEHMLFKGTKSRTGKEIAEVFDTIGGDLNAFTSKECTCYHAKVLDNHLEVAISVISEMLSSPTLAEDDIKKEQGVVLDEIGMAEDTPDDVSYDLIAKVIFGEDPLSRPILGTTDNIMSFTRKDIIDYMNKYYTPDNIVISIAGSFNEDETIEMLEKYMKSYPVVTSSPDRTSSSFKSSYDFIYKDLEQVHLEISYNGLAYTSKDLFSLAALNNIFGASMSSRLFQSIREDHGLTYSINSYSTQYESVGLFSIYACMNHENLFIVARLIKKELDKLRKDGVLDTEIKKVKEQLKGNYILDLEGSESYMNLLGKAMLFDKTIYTQDEVEDRINLITKESVNELIDRILSNDNYSIAAVGKVDKKAIKECYEILKI